jgi:hypothetical protein
MTYKFFVFYFVVTENCIFVSICFPPVTAQKMKKNRRSGTNCCFWITLIMGLSLFTPLKAQISGPKRPSFSTRKPQNLPGQNKNIPAPPTNYNPPGSYDPFTGSPNSNSDARARDEQMLSDERRGVDRETLKWQQERRKEAHDRAIDNHKVLFSKTFRQLLEIGVGAKPYSTKEAVFLCENTYFNNSLKREDFEKQIADAVMDCKRIMWKYHLDAKNNLAVNLAIQMYICDTVYIAPNRILRGYQYDHENFDGTKNWANISVSKLLKTHKGQCHSLPLLYKILIEEFHGEAYLADAPIHMYIQFKDSKGRFHNFETTNGTMPSEIDMQNFCYIKAAAIQNHIYLEPLTNKQVIGDIMIDLISAYQDLFGRNNDYFPSMCFEGAKALYPNSWRVLATKGRLLEDSSAQAWNAAGEPSLKETDAHPEKYKTFLAKYNREIDYSREVRKMGYEVLPDDIYEQMMANCRRTSPGRQERLKLVNQTKTYTTAHK